MDPNPMPETGAAPDRDARPSLSSRARRFGPAALALLGSMAAAATFTTLQRQDGPAAPDTAATPSMPGGSAYAGRTDPLWPAIDQWHRLSQSDRLPFADYAAFLQDHPGWPGETAMRRAAERQIVPGGTDSQAVIAFFAAQPPLTSTGRVRYAEALAAVGRTGEARDAAAQAWDGGALSSDDEGRLLARFAGQFTPAEQDARMERLLWDGAVASATRQLPLVSPGRRPLYAARLALQTRATDAGVQVAAVGPGAERDAGYLVDRAGWLRDTNQWLQARQLLAQPHSLDAPPFDPQKYLEALLGYAKAASNDHQDEVAFGIASQADSAFAAGTDVSARPLPQRDAYTSLVWIGATTALKKLNRPRPAEKLFRRYAAAAQSPGGKSRGLYWGGRAAQAAGDPATAQADWEEAAQNVDQFYGQLATERLGRTLAAPIPATTPDAGGSTLATGEVARAARLLGEQGNWQDQTQFVRQLAALTKTPADHAAAFALARQINRPDLAVVVSRSFRSDGTRDPLAAGFPTTTVPPAASGSWTMVHAIARQESQFDREALSPAGAHGLMQLMNATAREQAGKLGLSYQASRLWTDPGYNVTIGASFWERMLSYYGGSYPLAVASYNAGPGNVNRFVRNNGDPRLAGGDMVDWIEAIPIPETRAYVQKVLENAVVYDLLYPAHARSPARNRLSFYLGKPVGG
jgi:soluble lytic murein transglycosylase